MPFPEPPDVKLLRYRWNRLIEIWVAYNVFLSGEVEVGDDKVCRNPALVTQTMHTLLIVYYSYLYSLFDPSGTNFQDVTKAIDALLPESAREVRTKIVELWGELEKPITRIRHNIGFHGARAEDGHHNGFAQLRKFHPLLPQALVGYLRVFFRQLQLTFGGGRPLSPANRPDVDALLAYARAVEAEARQPVEKTSDCELARHGITRDAYEALLRVIEGTEDEDAKPN